MSLNIDKFTENMNIISSLPDRPTVISDELKREFDKGGNLIKEYLNGILIPGLETAIGDSLDDIKNIKDQLYPIGRGFMDFSGEDFSNYLGFKWERTLMGVFPVGCNPEDKDFANAGQTGGKKEFTLDIKNLPPHSFKYTYPRSELIAQFDRTYHDYGVHRVDDVTKNTNSIGNGEPLKHLPPYEVVNYWKRVG